MPTSMAKGRAFPQMEEIFYITFLKWALFSQQQTTGISRVSWHKRCKTGGEREAYHEKRKYELGRPAASTKIGPRCIHTVHVRGGNTKFRALRVDRGNFWGSEYSTRKTRIIDVYNASSNELTGKDPSKELRRAH